MVTIAAHNVISPLGSSTEATFEALLANASGVREHAGLLPDGAALWAARLPASWAAGLAQPLPAAALELALFEQLAIASVQAAQAQTSLDLATARTVFVLATTKGSIEPLSAAPEAPAAALADSSLPASAARIAAAFGNTEVPLVVSNACISGVNALLLAQRLLLAGRYDHAVVLGADVVSEFVYAGFHSFQALCAGPCRPFSADRHGLNLGEAAATIILTTDPALAAAPAVRLAGGAISNDANHLSGPSRTGQELALAIGRALTAAGTEAAAIDVISAHGTATRYNDEMEGKAFGLAGLAHAPLHSVKGALGHTLGAAGVVETALLALALQRGILLPTPGHSQPMPELPNPVLRQPRPQPLRYGLKTASGFGGCNGALVLERLSSDARS